QFIKIKEGALSYTVKNILYIGHNIQLAKSIISLFVPAPANYSIHHLSSIEQVETALAGREYTHLICELPFSHALADKIAADFPLLKTSYLNLVDSSKETELSMAMRGLMSDEVKVTLDYQCIPVYFKNKEGQFLACNSYFSKLFGLTSAQVIGKTAAEVLPPALLDGIEKIDKQLFNTRKVYFYECKLVDPAGRERDMVFRKEWVSNQEIQIGILFDVTEINEAKFLLEKERIMLRATADISTDFISFKDLQGRYLGCNKQFEKHVGCPEQEIVGKKDEQLFELKQALASQEEDQEVMRHNKTLVFEDYRADKNGNRHFVEIKKVPLQDKQGNVQGLIVIGRDITAHHLMQKRLRIADAAFENAKENLLVTDQMGIIISANKACSLACGFSKSELLGSHISMLACRQRDTIEAALQVQDSWQGVISYCIKNGETHFSWLEVNLIEHAEKGIYSRIYSFVDLNENKSVDKKIQFLSKYDPLTGAFNRIALFNLLEGLISRAIYKEVPIAVILVDINGFKAINDKYGYNNGDTVLKEIAQRLKRCVSEKDIVSRFGDDEFVLILDELATEQDVAIVAKKIAAQFEKPFLTEDFSIQLTATIGIAMCPDEGSDIDTLIGHAAKAMLRGKQDKSTSYHFYTMELTRYSHQQFAFEEELRQALIMDQFELYYQPQYDLNKKQIVALEALLRWNHPVQGILDSDSFLSLAENCGLMVDIGLKILHKAAMQAADWQKKAINFGRIVIHLSEVQLAQYAFIAELQTVLLETKCRSQCLEFEIDEVCFESYSPIVYENLKNISKMGISLTVVNFAQERGVFSLFKQLKIDKLKITAGHRDNVPNRFINNAVREALFVLTQSLGIDIVSDSLDNMAEASFSKHNSSEINHSKHQNVAMKASEATFYLRCHKHK
ncbi:MAG: diguanylate cyclase, partial [Psychromonas sp.]|nr:diguanylate cyclase [Psychromonas sp.]